MGDGTAREMRIGSQVRRQLRRIDMPHEIDEELRRKGHMSWTATDQLREPHPNQQAIDAASASVLRNSSPINQAAVEYIAEKLRTHPDYSDGEELDIECAIASLNRSVQRAEALHERCEHFERRVAELQSGGV